MDRRFLSSISTAKAVSVMILMYGFGFNNRLTEGAGQFLRNHTRGGKGRWQSQKRKAGVPI
jgi:hypothetical protein